MVRYATEGEKRWLRGFFNAKAKGHAAAEDPSITERDNPYRQFEHRTMWRDGFREHRAKLDAERAPTTAQRALLEKLAQGGSIIHASDGDRAWVSGLSSDPIFGDLDWQDLATLRRVGWIADADDGDDESRFPPPEVITEKGRSALAQQTEGER